MTAALHSSERYDLTQGWAVALARAGFSGIRYRVSHDPSQRQVGIALFATAGEAVWPVEATEPIGPDLVERVQTAFGIRVLPTPPTV